MISSALSRYSIRHSVARRSVKNIRLSGAFGPSSSNLNRFFYNPLHQQQQSPPKIRKATENMDNTGNNSNKFSFRTTFDSSSTLATSAASWFAMGSATAVIASAVAVWISTTTSATAMVGVPSQHHNLQNFWSAASSVSTEGTDNNSGDARVGFSTSSSPSHFVTWKDERSAPISFGRWLNVHDTILHIQQQTKTTVEKTKENVLANLNRAILTLGHEKLLTNQWFQGLLPKTVEGNAENSKTINPSPPSKFPTLEVKLIQQASVQNGADQTVDKYPNTFQLNAMEAQEFETELFKGKVLMILMPAEPQHDPYWTDILFTSFFSQSSSGATETKQNNNNKRIVIQIQGKFKKQPQGQVYMGGETAQLLKIGPLARGVATVILRILEGFAPSVFYSYGDHPENNDKEGVLKMLPRIVLPAHLGFSVMHVTPQGQNPPAISHEPFHESEEHRKQRLQTQQWDWNTSDTYSFTFHSKFMHLAKWELANLPVAAGMSLSSFWGDSPIRLAMYENNQNMPHHLGRETGKGENRPLAKHEQHLQKDNRYHFALQMKYTG